MVYIYRTVFVFLSFSIDEKETGQMCSTHLSQNVGGSSHHAIANSPRHSPHF
jgi:hypothetical protein